VPLDRLRRWEVHRSGLARAVAEALGTAGSVEEIVPARIWSLGHVALAGHVNDVFLARGLCWRDGPETVGKATRLLASERALVLVLASVPPPEVWRGDVPKVDSLTSLMTWDGKSLTVDQNVFVSLTRTEKKTKPRTAVFNF